MDYNGDGKVDSSEEFIDYQIYQDVMGSNQTSNQFPIPRGKRFDVFDIIIIVLIAYYILSAIADTLY